MSDNKVVDITSQKPHIGGEAICTECGYTWYAVCPRGTIELECPNCKRDFGLLKYPVIPDFTFVCNCGNDLFFLEPDGMRCRKCGIKMAEYPHVD